MAGGLAGVAAVGIPVLAAGGGSGDLILYGSLGQFAGHLGVVWWLARSRGGASSLGFQVEPSDLLYLFYGLGLQIVLPLLVAPLASLMGDGQVGQEVADQLRQLQGTIVKVMMAGVVTVLAPIAEELMFRGILLKATADRGAWKASFITALCFGGFHLFGLTGDLLTGVVLLLPVFMVVGLILARVTLRRGRLGPAIFIHSGFNLLAVVVLLLPADLLEQLAEG